MNEQGYLNVVGRLKDMVIRGGENLFPVEIEDFLIRHPKVAQVQVVGVPDAYFGEELLAVVIKRAGEHLTGEELRVYCTGPDQPSENPALLPVRGELSTDGQRQGAEVRTARAGHQSIGS